MEGLFVYTANKVEEVRTGADEGKQKGYKIVDVQELKSLAFWRAVGAEFLAQILFVYLGGSSAMFAADDNAKVIKIAFAFGLAIMALIQMIGHVSGGHINPAVTIAMAVALNISLPRAVLYVLAQIIGAILGGLILKGVTPDAFHDNLAVTDVNPAMTSGQGLGVEILLTFVLVFVIFGTTDENRPSFGSPSLLIGLTVTLCHLAGIPFTGASMNPSRSLGSAVASSSFSNHWVYWVGPILGGVGAAVVYKLLISPYRNTLSTEEAVQKMLQGESMVAIPRDYFKDNSRMTMKEGPAASAAP
ncbi:aquaporin-5-like [Babylonia areolata]|uniref:aquaporin-5-like n=1 Tax=Babylonia areolata TaxID=304850 RepID=UPI003FD50222